MLDREKSWAIAEGHIGECSLLALKIFHYIKELIVNLRSLSELDLDGVEIAKRVSDIEGPARLCGQRLCLRERGARLGGVCFHVGKKSGIKREDGEGLGDGEGKRSRGRME
jgi:hypothetical protein